jgi:transposase
MNTKIVRRQFTAEFKQQAVALLAANMNNLAGTARQVGVAPTVLRSWRDAGQSRAARLSTSQALAATAAPSAFISSPADMDAEVARLRAANTRLEMQNQILKKAIAVLSGDPI